jgi:septum formation protein
MALILASTSPHRRRLLRAAGIPFRIEAPGVDERVPPGSPKRVALILAAQKALAVAARRPNDLVVGSDQTVELDGELLRKPASRSAARRQVASLAGRSHVLHTAISVRRTSPAFRRDAVATVRIAFHPLSRGEIEAYLDTGEWEGCAGGYRVEGQGIKLVSSLRGDYHAVVGLPLIPLLGMLREAGMALFE